MTGHDKFLEQVTALLPALRAFGRSLCGDPARADDLVQDTVLKAWTNREQFQSGSNLKAWLFTILRNCYYSELRHRKFEIEDRTASAPARSRSPRTTTRSCTCAT